MKSGKEAFMYDQYLPDKYKYEVNAMRAPLSLLNTWSILLNWLCRLCGIGFDFDGIESPPQTVR